LLLLLVVVVAVAVAVAVAVVVGASAAVVRLVVVVAFSHWPPLPAEAAANVARKSGDPALAAAERLLDARPTGPADAAAAAAGEEQGAAEDWKEAKGRGQRDFLDPPILKSSAARSAGRAMVLLER